MRISVGMSGYAYKEWKGDFYPQDLRAEEMLQFYARHFPAVEINNTFYRMPSEKVIVQWAEQVPQNFVFVLKASQRITHMGRLKDVGDVLAYFLKNSSVLGTKLGPTLFQLPPNMKKDLARLQEFLKLLPHRWRAAFEFRHPSWFDDEVFDALRSNHAALCVADTDDNQVPCISTVNWGYLRLRREQYDQPSLQEWARTIKAQSWDEVFVFLKHEDDGGAGPRMALELRKMCEE